MKSENDNYDCEMFLRSFPPEVGGELGRLLGYLCPKFGVWSEESWTWARGLLEAVPCPQSMRLEWLVEMIREFEEEVGPGRPRIERTKEEAETLLAEIAARFTRERESDMMSDLMVPARADWPAPTRTRD